MKFLFKRYFICLSITLFFNSIGNSQNLQLVSKTEKIKVLDDASFVNEITINFKKSDKIRLYPIFYDTKLEFISNIKIYSKRGRRYKKLTLKKIYEEDIDLDYITSKKIKSIQIPAKKEIKLTYSVTCSELMYLSSLEFFSYYDVDTLNYHLELPNKYFLAHDIIDKKSIPHFSIDSLKTDTNSLWKIKIAPKKIEPDPLHYFGIYKNIKAPLMRTLVAPITYKNKPSKYMNDWYFKSLISKKVLNDDIKKKIDELTYKITDNNKIVNILYNYVKRNFKYVAIEIGMGAFIPTPVDEVFLNKQGDCKDLSNFLSEVLKYKGIKSDIALAATFDHISDCDFPSLSSANHVICIVYLDDKKTLLDPTDFIHVENQPVQSLQERTIFIINSNDGDFYKSNNFSPQQNEISYNLTLNLNSEKSILDGSFNINYTGISGNFLKRYFKSENKKDFYNFSKSLYEDVLGKQSISNLKYNNNANKFSLNGNLLIKGKTFNDNLNKYLFIDFLPRLFDTEDRETLLEGTYIRNPFYKKVRINIKIDEPIQFFEKIEHHFKEKGITLDLKIKYISKQEIECNYDFVFNHLFIDKSNIKKTNEILESFKKIINEPIVLKKQKL